MEFSPVIMINIEALKCRYESGASEVLKDINLKLDGDRIVIAGANGSGKTTLLKTIAGLAPATSGKVEVNGTDVSGIRGMTKLSTNLPDVFDIASGTVGETIRLWSSLKGSDTVEAMEMVRRYRLEEILSRRMTDLSTGQRKMVSNIIAISFRPDMLLMDEPFENVDQDRRLKLVRDILDFQGEAIVVTHEIHLLKQFKGWKLYFMIEGSLWGSFNPEEVDRLYLSGGRDENSLFTVSTTSGTVSVTRDRGDIQLILSGSISQALEEVMLQ